jgi:Phasin protein
MMAVAMIAGRCGNDDRWESKMSNQFKRGGPGNAGHTPNVPVAPGLALMMWNPFLTGDAEALGAFGTAGREWQDFVGRRLNEDVALLQRLTRSTAPDQILAAYADFWRKAGEDYGSEITTMTKLMADVTSRIAVAAQSATEQASTKLFQREAA